MAVYLGENRVGITTGSSGGSDEIFYAEYNVTTYQEVRDAVDGGKTVICTRNNNGAIIYYQLVADLVVSQDYALFMFTGVPSMLSVLQLSSDDYWGVTDKSITSVPESTAISAFDTNAKMNSTDMTSQEVDDFVDGLDVSGINAVDYITDYGTSGIWTYRKWNSGFCELRVKYTTPRTSSNTNFTATFPWTFATEPHVQISGGATANSASFARYANATTTSVDCYVDASSGSYVWAFIYVSGYLA